jgi:hypothetical protein
MVKPPPAEAGGRPSHRLDGGDEAKLLQRFHAIVEPDLFDDLSVLETQYRRSSEVHLATCRHRQRPNEEIAKRGTGMCAAAFPAANDVVAFGDRSAMPQKLRSEKAFWKSVMKALMSSRPRRGSCSE